MIHRAAFVLALALASAACGHSLEYTPLNAPPRALAPRSPESVELLMATRPSRAFVEVGLFEIEQRSPTSGGTPEMLAKVRARAAGVGCDALMVGEPTERVQSVTGQSYGTVHRGGGASYGTYQGMSTGSVNVVRGQRAVCIVYTEPQTTVTTGVAL
ncbi:MAG: hypothetical protein IPG50_32175 [Myxococcales bacterium]|nr:hypothetical protein [Myxococcales bacterium]